MVYNINRKVGKIMEQIAGYVYVVFCESRHQVGTNYGDWSPRYEYEKEIEFILDNEDKANEMIQEFNNTFGRDENVSYYYEMWEVMHHA